MKLTQDFESTLILAELYHGKMVRLFKEANAQYGRVPTRFRRILTLDVNEDNETINLLFTQSGRTLTVKDVCEILKELVGGHSLGAVNFDRGQGWSEYTTSPISRHFAVHTFAWQSFWSGHIVKASFVLETPGIEGSIVAWEKPAELASKVL